MEVKNKVSSNVKHVLRSKWFTLQTNRQPSFIQCHNLRNIVFSRYGQNPTFRVKNCHFPELYLLVYA